MLRFARQRFERVLRGRNQFAPIGGMGPAASPDCRGCNCGACCNLIVNTAWCALNCVAPGVITVVVRKTNAMGAVVCTATADAMGNAVCCIAQNGTYYFTATTNAAGFLNLPTTMAIAFTSNGNPCNPATVGTPLYPDHLVVNDGVFGAVTVLPFGTDPVAGGPGNQNLYVGATGALTFLTACGCPPQTVMLHYAVTCVTGTLLLEIFLLTDASIIPTGCPDATGNPAGAFTSAVIGLTGTGPNLGGGGACYPVSMTGSHTYQLAGPGLTPPVGPIGILYGGCLMAITENYTVTS